MMTLPNYLRLGAETRRDLRLRIRLLAVLLGVAGGYAVEILLHKQKFLWSILPFAILFLSAIVEFVFGDLIADIGFPFETERKLAMLEQKLGVNAIKEIESKLQRTIERFKACNTAHVSGTVHMIIELVPSAEGKSRRGLVQLTEYVGRPGGRKGRITMMEQGVIGRCARTSKTEVVNFSEQLDYEVRMVEEFGFSKAESAAHENFARSYIAHPLILGDATIGVLYFYSIEPQVFPKAVNIDELESAARDLVGLLKAVSLV